MAENSSEKKPQTNTCLEHQELLKKWLDHATEA